MKAKHLIVVLLLSTPFLSAFLHSQQPEDGMQLLKRVSETYRGLESYEIRAVVIKDQRLEDEARNLTETPLIMAQDKPGKFRFEEKHPFMGAMEVSDGKTAWKYSAMGHQYTKEPAGSGPDDGNDNPLMPTNYVKHYRELAAKATEAHLLREETFSLEGKQVRCAVVEVKFAVDETAKKKQEPHTLWIDRERALVIQEMWDDKNTMMGVPAQTQTTVTYKAIHIGQPVADALFSFTPPTNAREVTELALLGTSKRASTSRQPGHEFTLSTLEGKKTSLSDFKGKTVLLDFWATSCVPCRESTPLVEKINSAFSSKGLVTLAVDFGEEEAAVKGYLAHNPSSLPNLVDPNGTVADLYEVNSIPTFILISKDGKVTYRSSGFGDGSEAALRAALKLEGLE